LKSQQYSEVNIYSARDFLSDQKVRKAVQSASTIWITSSPKSQLEVLELLEGYKGNVILEKPLATNSSGLQLIHHVLGVASFSMHFCQPWTFSNLFKEIERLLASTEIPQLITIVRKGFSDRAYTPAYIDWLPHDKYLLAALYQYSEVKSAQKLPSNTELNEGTFLIDLNSGTRIVISGGHLNVGREASWQIDYSNGSIVLIDFTTGEVITKITGDCEPAKITILENNPLLTMYKHFENETNQSDLQNQILWQQCLYIDE
jgi:predicted dehydrogenase